MIKASVTRVARRRLHDGDLNQEIFILDIEECATVKSETSILMLYSKFYQTNITFFFVMDNNNQPTDVTNYGMLVTSC